MANAPKWISKASPAAPYYSLLLGNVSHEALVEARDDCYDMLVQGTLYRVLVQDERMRRLAQAARGFARPVAKSPSKRRCRAWS